MRRAGLILATLAAFVLPAEIARAAVIFPPNGHLTSDSGVTVMLHVGEKDPRSLTLTFAGKEKAKVDLQPGFNSVEVELESGENVLRWGTETRLVFMTTGEGKAAEGYEVHFPHEALDDCQNCHSGKGTELKAEEPDLCIECHDDPKGPEGEKRTVHAPVADGDCSSCHAAHESSVPKLLIKEGAEMCAECHDGVNADAERKPFPVQHEPVEAGDCLDCHLVHSSAEPALAKAGDGKLCVECHEDPAQKNGAAPKSVHDPVGSGECLSCHVVHGGGEESLLARPGAELCAECHEGTGSSDEGEKFSAPHSPVEEGECTSCHDAHSADNEALAKAAGEKLCIECHDDPRRKSGGGEFPAQHAALEDGCLPCHKVHGSNTPKLLSAPGINLCIECHDDIRLNDEGSSWQYLHLPVEEGKCEGCHAPHGGEVKGLLPAGGNRLCLGCHKSYHPNHRSGDLDRIEKKSIILPVGFPLEKPGLDLSCRGCHQHHGSDYEVLLAKDRVMLCADCHRF